MLPRNFKPSSVQIFSRSRVKLVVCISVIAIFFYEFGVLTHFFERDYYTKFTYPIEVNVEDILVAVRSANKPQIEPINPFNYHYKITNAEKCKQISDSAYDKVVILYVIKSALDNRKPRIAIRNTWGWEGRFSDVIIRRVFILGTSEDPKVQDAIDEEYAQYKDLIQFDFLDTYYNNTIKTMMGFKWVVNHCPNSQFILFADDDMYLSTKNLLKFLRNPFNENMDYRKLLQLEELSNLLGPKSKSPIPMTAFDGRLLAGYVFFSSPMRYRFSKWYITLDEYPFSKYPPYVTAGAYVMSYPALEDLFYISQYTKPFKFDDIYLGIVAKKCSIIPMHNENFYFWRKPYNKYGYKSVIASHGFKDPEELVRIWEEQRSMGHA